MSAIPILYVGDSLAVLRTMADESIQCCVTSPPYWALRDYGVHGQIGLESTPEEYIARMVGIFREVRRVLDRHGTCWINIGDSYAGAAHGTRNRTLWPKQSRNDHALKRAKKGNGIKSKDMVGIPWALAFALRADGWYLRQDIVWEKPNPMPESVRDRCTKAHEYIFLLSKSPKYYWDREAMLERASPNTHARMRRNSKGSTRANGGATPHDARPFFAGGRKFADESDSMTKAKRSFAEGTNEILDRRNKRSVWRVGTQAFRGAHFATFPPKLIEPCILASVPRGGIVLDPFAGTATTGFVALAHGRRFIGIELNPKYAELARQRVPCLEISTL